MTPAASDTPRLVHSLPGRARVHVPTWTGAGARALERQTCRLRGVRKARANPVTRNVLIHFDTRATDHQTLVDRVSRLTQRVSEADEHADQPPSESRSIKRISTQGGRRARIAVRGLERDPDLGRRVVERLESHPGVARVAVSLLTGRVLVELADEADIDFEDVAAVLAELEPADEDADAPPAHPLDPAPLIEGSAKLIGAGLGLGLLIARRATGAPGAPVTARGPAETAAALGIVEGNPALVARIEQALGHEGKEVLFGAVAIVSLTFSGSTLGLALAGASAARLLTEALARRSAWQEYEERSADGPSVHPGGTVTLQPGDRLPLPAEVLDGFGSASEMDGSLAPVTPGIKLRSGARLYGGPFRLRLSSDGAFSGPEPADARRPSPEAGYLRAVGPGALAYAALIGLLTRSVGRALTGLLLVNPRPALHGSVNADRAASERAIRSGVTVVASRSGRPIRRPDALLLDSPRVLADGVEPSEIVALTDAGRSEVERIAGSVAAAAGSPWGDALATNGPVQSSEGSFDGRVARAEIDGQAWTLGPAAGQLPPALERGRAAGEHILVLAADGRAIGLIALRPRLAAGVESLVAACRRRGVRLEALSARDSVAGRALCERASVPLVQVETTAARVRSLRESGEVVAVVSDGAHAAEAFAVSDLAIARTSGRRGAFAARADLLAPGLDAVAAIVEAGARRDLAVRDSVGLSIAANAAGAIWGLRGAPTVEQGSTPTYLGGLAAILAGSVRLRGGTRSRSVAERLANPVPERFGRESPETVLDMLETSARGLSSADAQRRWRAPAGSKGRSASFQAVLSQLRSPLVGFLGLGAGLSLAMGATADVVMIGAVICLNAAVSVWQERKAGSASAALAHMTARTATVLRDGAKQTVDATALVPGDVLVLAPGDRVPADARLMEADRLEVDESALTGESLPVAKAPHGGTDSTRVVLEGSDVTVGTARAVVVAVGADTRMGAMAAALAADQSRPNPLDVRLSRILRRGVPLILLGGTLVTLGGVLWGQPLLPQLAIGASIAIAAVPEGLPLLAGVAEAGVAQRLAGRRAVVTRLAAVEALGRADVACADKTGTMTEGVLTLELVSDTGGRSGTPSDGDSQLRRVLVAAALASPHPGAPDSRSHPTDVAVMEAANAAGMESALDAPRVREEPFDPARGFHATSTTERLYVKGAAEVLAPRCRRVRTDGSELPLDEGGHRRLLRRADALAEQGYRVLMVAEGPPDVSAEDPRELSALGFIGIRDPIRPGVPAAVRRCREAGVRVVMVTGDHPATAAAIARDAGLLDGRGELITGPELATLDDEALDDHLGAATVIARSSPLDKLRIVEALQRRGHVVAMTGDGVNDAPALRLADVGVAMGEAGTEVARQAADVVVTDDDFSTLVEGLVEGRGFWRNMRRALGLLLGGNLGEVGLMVAAGVTGMAAPMTARQILAVNLVTDVLPAVAVAVQRPDHRHLAYLQREGAEALDATLRGDVIRRGIATALPSFGAYMVASRASQGQGRTVAFASVVSTQLGQTLQLGRSESGVGRSVSGAVAASAGVLAATLLFAPLRGFLGLAAPTPMALALIAGATFSAVAVHRGLAPARKPREPAEEPGPRASLAASTP